MLASANANADVDAVAAVQLTIKKGNDNWLESDRIAYVGAETDTRINLRFV